MKSVRLYLQLIRHIRPRWRLSGIAFALAFACVLLNLTQPYLISRFIDEVLIGHDRSLVLPLLGLSLGLTLLTATFTVVQFSIFRFLESRHTLDIRSRILQHIRKIPLPEIEKNGAGKYVALMGMDTSTTARFINVVAVELLTRCLQSIVAIVLLFGLDWRLGLIVAAGIPVLLSIPRLFARPIRAAVQGLRTHNESIGSYLYESIQGSREIRAYGLEDWENERNEEIYRHIVQLSVREGFFRLTAGQAGTFAVAVAVVLLYGFGSAGVINGALSVGMVVAAVQYVYSVLNPIQSINHLVGDLIGSEVAIGRIEAFLRSPTEVQEEEEEAPADRGEREAAAGSAAELPVRRTPIVSARGMDVAYEGSRILSGIDLDIYPGQVVAFVGRSGSGKSTLFKALLRFMPVESGELLVDGRPLSRWSRREMASRISYVSQDTFLFHGTLYENVELGKRGATEEEVYEALKKVDLQELVDSLPDGIHTAIDNQGSRLSGGQRQRLAIARAILKKPDLLILDEPTSALDRETEDQVLQTIGGVMRGSTTLISTHRLSTIRSADLIVVLDGGRVVDQGSHYELLGRCGVYASLVRKEELLMQSLAEDQLALPTSAS